MSERERIWSGFRLSVSCCERGSHKEGDWSRDICVYNWDQPLQPKTVMAVEYTWHQAALFLGSLGIGLPKSLFMGPKLAHIVPRKIVFWELSVTVYQQRMAESTEKQRDSEPKQHEEADEDDYMGDLSQFLPPETTNPSKSSAKKVSIWLFPCNNEVSKAFILYYHSKKQI